MNANKTKTILLIVGLVGCHIIVGQLRGDGQTASAGGDTWQLNVAGTYVNVVPAMEPQTNAAVVLTTLVPLDPMGTRLKMVEEWVNGDSTFMGMFPEADMAASFVMGEAVKTGHDTYKFSVIGYNGKKVHGDRGVIQLIWGEVGSLRIIDSDTIETFDLYVVAYTGAQDKDLDGLPDSDEEPILCIGPFADDMKRVALTSPCQAEPMPAP